VIPSKRLLWLLGGWLAFSLVASIFPALEDAWLIGSALLALIFVADALAGYFNKLTPIIERRIASTLPVGVWRDVTLKFSHPNATGRNRLSFAAFDSFPRQCEAENLPISLTLTPGNYALATYRFRPDVRGDLVFGRVMLRIKSPFGLWEVVREAGQETHVRSFPNFAEITRYALLAVDNRLSQIYFTRISG
jgi:uncharacterized protein (DUF58 family)